MFASASGSPASPLAYPSIKTAYPKGSVLFMEGQDADHVVCIRVGRVKLSTLSPEGRSFVLRIATPGQIVGLIAVLTGKTHFATAETLDYCEVDLIRAVDLAESFRKHLQASLWASQQIAAAYRNTCNQIKLRLLGGSRRERFASFLLQLPLINDDSELVRTGMTHEQIAEMIGVNREAVTRLMQEFRTKQLIEIKHNGLIVRNLTALRRLCHLADTI